MLSYLTEQRQNYRSVWKRLCSKKKLAPQQHIKLYYDSYIYIYIYILNIYHLLIASFYSLQRKMLETSLKPCIVWVICSLATLNPDNVRLLPSCLSLYYKDVSVYIYISRYFDLHIGLHWAVIENEMNKCNTFFRRCIKNDPYIINNGSYEYKSRPIVRKC